MFSPPTSIWMLCVEKCPCLLQSQIVYDCWCSVNEPEQWSDNVSKSRCCCPVSALMERFLSNQTELVAVYNLQFDAWVFIIVYLFIAVH